MDIVTSWYTALGKDAQDIVKASLGPTVAILLFVATQLAQIAIALGTRRREKRRFLTGVYREIAENLRYARGQAQALDVSLDRIRTRLQQDDSAAVAAGKEPAYRPLLAITESSRFYEGVLGSIQTIETKVLVAISAYYRAVADQKLATDAIASYAFLHITVASRCELINELATAVRDTDVRGQVAITAMDAQYPARWFRDLRP